MRKAGLVKEKIKACSWFTKLSTPHQQLVEMADKLQFDLLSDAIAMTLQYVILITVGSARYRLSVQKEVGTRVPPTVEVILL